MAITLNRRLALLASRLRQRESRLYWLVHELHLFLYWRGREDLRWRLHNKHASKKTVPEN